MFQTFVDGRVLTVITIPQGVDSEKVDLYGSPGQKLISGWEILVM